MISYDPLGETLKKKGLTIYKLQAMINNYNLRVVLNSGRYLELKTIDRICTALKCKVEDVMEFKEGPQVIKEIVRNKFYVVDWDKVIPLMNEKGLKLTECSVEMGKAPSFLSTLMNKKRVTYKALRILTNYFEKLPEEIAEPV